ncbi:MAG: GNAT family N-acetyltransferase [Rhodocyclaceae bacterium]|nr:GNAT family N-acetyltransferase [Rhodocyclaceae bacterium]
MPTSRIIWKNLPALALQQDGPLLPEWDRLNSARGNLPFMAGEAIVSALKTLGEGSERLLVAYEGPSILAMVILSPLGKFRWQTFQPPQLPLGAWVAEAHVPLLDIARSLLRGPVGPCLALSITQVDPRIAPRVEDTPDSQSGDYITTSWIDIDGSFEDYWSTRGKNLRHNMRKQRAKLQGNGVKLTMQTLRSHADMAPAVARYGELESSGWKAQQGTAIHMDNEQGRYYRDLLEQASRRGEAVVYQYLFDDRVVAMNLCLVRNGTLVVLKTTYDETVQAYSPAFLLSESELQELHGEGQVRRLEYFGRLMDWHTRWTDQTRTLYHLTLYRWPFLRQMASLRRRMTQTQAKDGAANPA